MQYSLNVNTVIVRDVKCMITNRQLCAFDVVHIVTTVLEPFVCDEMN